MDLPTLEEINKFMQEHFQEGDEVYGMWDTGKIVTDIFKFRYPIRWSDNGQTIVDKSHYHVYSPETNLFAWNVTRLGQLIDESKRLKFEKQIDSYQII